MSRFKKFDVYIEDENDEVVYKQLLNQATHGKVRVARVFALGGRNAVLKAASEHDQATRRALFIIDGDLHWVKGEPKPAIVGLHRHEAYCIENLLLCERALSTIVSQEVVITEEEAHRRLAYDKWRHSITSPLAELFAAFATVHDCNSTVSTVSQGVGVMCVNLSSKVTVLDPQKSDKRAIVH